MPQVLDGTTADSFFTVTSLVSFQGATLFATLAPAVVKHVAGGKIPDGVIRGLTLLLAFLLAYFVALQAKADGSLVYLLAFANGLLIYAAAQGLIAIGNRNSSKPVDDPNP